MYVGNQTKSFFYVIPNDGNQIQYLVYNLHYPKVWANLIIVTGIFSHLPMGDGSVNRTVIDCPQHQLLLVQIE